MHSRSIKVALALGVAAATYVVYAFDPVTSHLFPRCLFHELTGLQCPGCGGTRALHALLHGHFATAIHFNAFLIFGAPFIAAGAAKDGLRRPWAGWAVVVVLIGWGVLRNLV